jgi:hypothetical protein
MQSQILELEEGGREGESKQARAALMQLSISATSQWATEAGDTRAGVHAAPLPTSPACGHLFSTFFPDLGLLNCGPRQSS